MKQMRNTIMIQKHNQNLTKITKKLQEKRKRNLKQKIVQKLATKIDKKTKGHKTNLQTSKSLQRTKNKIRRSLAIMKKVKIRK